MSLTVDAIRSFRPRTLRVPVSEWGGDLYLRPISGAQREEWVRMVNERIKDGKLSNQDGLRGWLLVRSLCNEAGVLLWPETAVSELMDLDGVVLERLFDAAMQHSGLTGPEAVESAEKNSEPTTNGASGSG